VYGFRFLPCSHICDLSHRRCILVELKVAETVDMNLASVIVEVLEDTC
jgi:hypothetical protein